MGFFSYLRGDDLGQKALTGTPAVLEVLNSRRFNAYRPLGGTNVSQDRINGVYVAMQNAAYGWIYRSTPVVRKVIEYQAAQVSQLGLKLYERVDDDDRRQVGDHPAARSLRRPNPWTPGKKFIRGLVTSFLVYDNAYAIKFPDGDGFMLVEVSPAWVGLVGQSHYQVDAYRIWRSNGEYFDVPPDRMVHWRGENPDDPKRGESKLETAREELAADAAARQANTELHRSGLALPGWIERPMEAPLITEEGLKRLRESLANQAKASRREYPILEEGMKFHSGGVTPEDAELLAARRWTSEEFAGLYGMFNVPPRTDEERRQFYSDVLPDITGQLADFLTLQILREDYGLEDHYFEFNLDDKLMGDERIKTLTSAAGAPIMLRDEARAKLNLPALPDGQGEEIIVPANVTEGEGKPSIGVMPIQDPNKPSQDGDFRSGEAEEPDRAGSRASLVVGDGLMNGPAGLPAFNGHHKAPLIPRRRLASQRRDRWATEYWGVMDRHFKRQRRALKSQRTKAVTDNRWNTELADDVNVVAMRQFEAEGKHVAFRLASTFDPDQGQNWLRVKSLRSAEAINRTTQEQIDEFGLDKAFDHGESRAVAAGMAYATDVAAFSTRVACEQAPGEPTVIIDGGECEVCAPFQGAWSFSEVQWPSYHANCNCVADVESAPFKSVPIETKAQELPPITVNITLPAINMPGIDIPEGAIQFEANVEAPPPAQISMEAPQVNVAPAETHFHEGAMKNIVEAPPPADVRTVFDKGAFQVENTVEAPPSADVRMVFDKGAFEVTNNVEAPEAPNVNVSVEQPPKTTKRVIRDANGHIKEIVEEGRKQTVTRDNKNRIESIEEE